MMSKFGKLDQKHVLIQFESGENEQNEMDALLSS